MNEELSTDELKDVAGGTKCATGEHIDKLVQKESFSIGKMGEKGKKGPDTNLINSEGSAEEGLMGMRNGAK